jgi:hypothetical protein
MEDFSIFIFIFDTVSSVMNMRYFESQQIVIEDGDEECEINCALFVRIVWWVWMAMQGTWRYDGSRRMSSKALPYGRDTLS